VYPIGQVPYAVEKSGSNREKDACRIIQIIKKGAELIFST